MSGGAFDYKQYYIDDIIEHVGRIVRAVEEGDIGEDDGTDQTPSYWEKSLLADSKEEVKEEFKKALKALRIAACYAQRIDWFLSGDDDRLDYCFHYFINLLLLYLLTITKTIIKEDTSFARPALVQKHMRLHTRAISKFFGQLFGSGNVLECHNIPLRLNHTNRRERFCSWFFYFYFLLRSLLRDLRSFLRLTTSPALKAREEISYTTKLSNTMTKIVMKHRYFFTTFHTRNLLLGQLTGLFIRLDEARKLFRSHVFRFFRSHVFRFHVLILHGFGSY